MFQGVLGPLKLFQVRKLTTAFKAVISCQEGKAGGAGQLWPVLQPDRILPGSSKDSHWKIHLYPVGGVPAAEGTWPQSGAVFPQQLACSTETHLSVCAPHHGPQPRSQVITASARTSQVHALCPGCVANDKNSGFLLAVCSTFRIPRKTHTTVTEVVEGHWHQVSFLQDGCLFACATVDRASALVLLGQDSDGRHVPLDP